MALLLALAAAVGWGSSDFFAGRASRHSPVVSVVMVTHLVSLACMLLMALRWPLPTLSVGKRAEGTWLGLEASVSAPSLRGNPLGSDLLWGAGAGISAGLGAALLFRGLARGRASLVAPITAVGAATLPLLWSLLRGSPLSLASGSGIGIGLVAILLISMAGDAETESGAGGANPPREPGGADVPGGGEGSGSVLREAGDQAAAGGPPPPMAIAARPLRRRPVPWAHGVAATVFPATAAICLIGLLSQASGSAAGSVAFASSGSLGVAILAAAGAATMGWVALQAGGRDRWLRGGGQPGRPGRGASSTFGSAAEVGWLSTGPPRRAAAGSSPMAWAGAVGGPHRAGLAEALVSGVGFGMFFILLDRTSADAGVWPMAAARGASVALFVLAALLTRTATLPSARSSWSAVLAGVLDGVAAASFLVAARYLALSVVVVITSLYPVVTVLLALSVDHQRLCRRHVVGLTLAGVAVTLLVLAR